MAFATLTFSDESGSHSTLLDRPSTSIGRSPTQQIVLRDPCVSRLHALVLCQGDACVVVDQNSTHGTFLNGVRVQQATLHPGDILQLGSVNGLALRFTHAQTRVDRSSLLTMTGFGQTGLSQTGLSQTVPRNLLSSLADLPGSAPSSAAQGPAAQGLAQLNWLLDAARSLNEGGATNEIFDALLHFTLELTRLERGFVFLAEDGEMRLARGLNASGMILNEDLTVSRRAIATAIQSQSTFSVSDTLADEQASEWHSMIANRIRSIYCIPMRKRGATPGGGTAEGEPAEGGTAQRGDLLGLLYLDSQIGPGHLTEVDHQLLELIATEAAALLHNTLLAEADRQARKAQEELAVAATIHSGLMAIALPVLPYAELQARTVPCLAIGGDFYDAVVIGDTLCVTIADVSGKGVSAAIVAATLQGIIHAQLLACQPLAEIAALVNQFLCTRKVGKYATLVMLQLSPDGGLEYINCGHVQPVVVSRASGMPPLRRLEESNLVVGLIAQAEYSSRRDTLLPGDRLLLVTDGITEAEDPSGEAFGDEGLAALAPNGTLDSILAAVAAFQAPNAAQDDCTMLQLTYKSAS